MPQFPPSISQICVSAGLGTVLEVEGSMMKKTHFVPIKLNYKQENIIFLHHCVVCYW